MAAEHHKPFILFRPNFILLCLYVGAYAWLRSAEQIVAQTSVMSAARGEGSLWTIAASPDLPRWRRQAWRALFSLPMVLEEEGRRHENVARDLYNEAVAAVTRNAPSSGRAAAPVRYAAEPMPAPMPVQREQARYRQPVQPGRQVQSYPPLNEGERLIYMPTPEEQRRQQSLYRAEQY